MSWNWELLSETTGPIKPGYLSNTSAPDRPFLTEKAEKKPGFQQYVRLREPFPGKKGGEKRQNFSIPSASGNLFREK